MKIAGKYYRTIWEKESDEKIVQVIDQRFLPYEVVIEELKSVEDTAKAIADMHIRGAGLIGAAAGYGMYLSALQAPRDSEANFTESLINDGNLLKSTRPTAVNLSWAVDRLIREAGMVSGIENKIETARNVARMIADEDAAACKKIGEYGVGIIEEISRKKRGETVSILTHCNAGWLAFVDYGTATAPIYEAHKRGISVHVYVDETRPRNQGGRLTAFELEQNGIPYTIIADNAGGHLMQHKMVDMVIVGSDRTTASGDVANKIGTYLKAVAANANDVPFYVALPTSSIDRSIDDGIKEIPIETRDEDEIKYISGITREGRTETILITPKESRALNYGFDVTPAHLVTSLITEKGVCPATKEGILKLFSDNGSV